ncbi:MAG: transketolase C-terminal domain-containing protein, partial [Propionicimonas sp.]|nr:transketolase C-terminal domain-containing protein [Propionicimonas sp.]
AAQAVKAVEASLEYPGPIYIRVARGEEPAVYPEGADYDYQIGRSILVRDGLDATVVGTGIGVWLGQQASQLLAQEGLSVRVLDMHTIKPLDTEAVLKAVDETGVIVTVEDHNVRGGLGSLVAETIATTGRSGIVRKLGIPDEFAVLGYAEGIYTHYGFDVEGVAATVRDAIKNKKRAGAAPIS